MILDPLDEADRAYMNGLLAARVRILYPLLIERPWKKYGATLRSGTWLAGSTSLSFDVPGDVQATRA